MKIKFAQAALLLPLLVCGCAHKQKAQNQPPLAPPIEDTPPSKPDKAPANLPPPVITVPQPTQPAATNTPPKEQPAPPPKHRKPKPAQPADQQQNTQVAANNPPGEVSAAGGFSEGVAPDIRKQTSDSIDDTERGLNGITRKLSDQEQKTSTQIRAFLKEARTALTTGDVDGAHTLAQKAKVLLAELRQQ